MEKLIDIENGEVLEILVAIQTEIKVPKAHYSEYGNYNFRTLEDINECVKPLLAKHKSALTFADEIVQRGDRFYARALCTLFTPKGKAWCVSEAREPVSKPKLDDSQTTGSARTYARKGAVSGLFALADSEDADENHDRTAKPEIKTPQKAQQQKKLMTDKEYNDIVQLMQLAGVTPQNVANFHGVRDIRELNYAEVSARLKQEINSRATRNKQ